MSKVTLWKIAFVVMTIAWILMALAFLALKYKW